MIISSVVVVHWICSKLRYSVVREDSCQRKPDPIADVSSVISFNNVRGMQVACSLSFVWHFLGLLVFTQKGVVGMSYTAERRSSGSSGSKK